MKDKQIGPSSAEARIPFVSAALHCVSMTVLVYLRSSFGFGFLRPKSVFFAFSWAFILYVVYARIDGEAWRQHRALLIFGMGAVFLYGWHLLIAFQREWNQTGEHEHYSGASHLVWFWRRANQSRLKEFEARLHLWWEPGAVFFASLAIRLIFGASQLSLWLLFAAVCLWFKEALNYWFGIRQYKRQRDNFADTEETVEPLSQSGGGQEPPKATRKAKVKRSRNDAFIKEDADCQEQRFAEVLRLLPPYTPEAAERNYRALIKEEHPDANDGSEASTARTRELNAAVDYFRSLKSTLN